MRKIIFRGKRLDNGMWANGFYLQGGYIPGANKENVKVRHIISDDFYYDVDPDTIGQFTGLFDKNGKEVYEGDIVRFRVSDNRYNKNPRYITKTIRYDNRSARFEADGIFWINLSSDRIEVIGNMFDCPELVEKGGES